MDTTRVWFTSPTRNPIRTEPLPPVLSAEETLVAVTDGTDCATEMMQSTRQKENRSIVGCETANALVYTCVRMPGRLRSLSIADERDRIVTRQIPPERQLATFGNTQRITMIQCG